MEQIRVSDQEKRKSATPAALSEAPTVVVTPSQPVNRALEFNIGTGPNTPQTPQTRPEPNKIST